MRVATSPAQLPLPRNLTVVDLAPSVSSLLAEVLSGLAEPQRRLPPKLFYDARGVELYNRICTTQAYYPTRTEREILARHARDIAQAVGTGAVVVEPGAGDMRKIRLLLSSLRPRAYVPIDLALGQLRAEAEVLAREQPQLEVTAVSADFYSPGLQARLLREPGRKVVFFPGSTIGNFEPPEALAFLRRARALAGEGGAALIGVDLHKPAAILERAYDDPEGYTAQFNLNLLARLNREMGADFDLGAFAHRAFYNEHASRIEMHLVSRRAQTVRIAGRRVEFAAGETIHTENSYKFALQALSGLARDCGFDSVRAWTDPAAWFGVFLLS